MQFIKALEEAQKSIILDFIIKLLLSQNSIIKVSYNSVLVITNQLTKYAYFINYLKVLNTKDLIYTFLRMIFVNHDISIKIISN